jgi:hypothetical protein
MTHITWVKAISCFGNKGEMAWNIMCAAATGVILELGGSVVVMDAYADQGLNWRITVAGITLAAIKNTIDVHRRGSEGVTISIYFTMAA